jgi:hypothetical protein
MESLRSSDVMLFQFLSRTKMKIVPTSGWTCARHLAPIDRVHDLLGLLIYFFNDMLFGFIKEMSPQFSHKLQPTHNIYS